MHEERLQSPGHSSVRAALRVAGPVVAIAGLALTVIGLASFFASFGGFESPRYFWCAFVGLPLLFIGGSLCLFGYMGSLNRYVAAESAPVAKDVVNYMGQNTQPGVKAMAKAVTEGVLEAQRESPPPDPDRS